MIWLYKAKNWIVAHKNWLVLVGLFILSYVLGRRSNQNYLEMANLAKDQYKKENEELERLQKAKQVRDKRAEQKAKAVKAALEVEKENKVLEIGTGSGYQAAVLGILAKEVYSIEIVDPLCEQSRKLLKKRD